VNSKLEEYKGTVAGLLWVIYSGTYSAYKVAHLPH